MKLTYTTQELSVLKRLVNLEKKLVDILYRDDNSILSDTTELETLIHDAESDGVIVRCEDGMKDYFTSFPYIWTLKGFLIRLVRFIFPINGKGIHDGMDEIV